MEPEVEKLNLFLGFRAHSLGTLYSMLVPSICHIY